MSPWSRRFIPEWARPPARNLPDLSARPAVRGFDASWPDFELAPVVKYTSRPVVMITDHRLRRGEVSTEVARELGYSRAPDLLAYTAFEPDLEPGAYSRYKKADCNILKSFFAAPIADPGIAKGQCFVVEFRGDDSPDYRQASAALGLQSFLINLKASGTRWRAYALGSETIVLLKERRANRPLITLTLVGEGYNPNGVVREGMFDDREGAGVPAPWHFLLLAVRSYFDDIEITTAAPYPEMLDLKGERRRLLICVGSQGMRAYNPKSPRDVQEAQRECVRGWEAALRDAGACGWARDELAPGTVRLTRPLCGAQTWKGGQRP